MCQFRTSHTCRDVVLLDVREIRYEPILCLIGLGCESFEIVKMDIVKTFMDCITHVIEHEHNKYGEFLAVFANRRSQRT